MAAATGVGWGAPRTQPLPPGSGPDVTSVAARAEEWLVRYAAELGHSPENTEQLLAFAANRGERLGYSMARRAVLAQGRAQPQPRPPALPAASSQPHGHVGGRPDSPHLPAASTVRNLLAVYEGSRVGAPRPLVHAAAARDVGPPAASVAAAAARRDAAARGAAATRAAVEAAPPGQGAAAGAGVTAAGRLSWLSRRRRQMDSVGEWRTGLLFGEDSPYSLGREGEPVVDIRDLLPFFPMQLRGATPGSSSGEPRPAGEQPDILGGKALLQSFPRAEAEPGTVCAICIDEAVAECAERWLRVPCGHLYHEECLAELLQLPHRRSCPLCRLNLESSAWGSASAGLPAQLGGEEEQRTPYREVPRTPGREEHLASLEGSLRHEERRLRELEDRRSSSTAASSVSFSSSSASSPQAAAEMMAATPDTPPPHGAGETDGAIGRSAVSSPTAEFALSADSSLVGASGPPRVEGQLQPELARSRSPPGGRSREAGLAASSGAGESGGTPPPRRPATAAPASGSALAAPRAQAGATPEAAPEAAEMVAAAP
uniref:RING-type domain-containing protein n=1 Tax=Pyrodinium bahamense TaxID=73915 RepID=A0A7S0FYF6_9DINO